MLTVPMLVDALQRLLSWWVEHPGGPREQVEQRAVEFGWRGLDRMRRGERVPKTARQGDQPGALPSLGCGHPGR